MGGSPQQPPAYNGGTWHGPFDPNTAPPAPHGPVNMPQPGTPTSASDWKSRLIAGLGGANADNPGATPDQSVKSPNQLIPTVGQVNWSGSPPPMSQLWQNAPGGTGLPMGGAGKPLPVGPNVITPNGGQQATVGPLQSLPAPAQRNYAPGAGQAAQGQSASLGQPPPINRIPPNPTIGHRYDAPNMKMVQ